ncbi:hypothetical protein LCGC14_1557600, partial [marine sediment metagenome]
MQEKAAQVLNRVAGLTLFFWIVKILST